MLLWKPKSDGSWFCPSITRTGNPCDSSHFSSTSTYFCNTLNHIYSQPQFWMENVTSSKISCSKMNWSLDLHELSWGNEYEDIFFIFRNIITWAPRIASSPHSFKSLILVQNISSIRPRHHGRIITPSGLWEFEISTHPSFHGFTYSHREEHYDSPIEVHLRLVFGWPYSCVYDWKGCKQSNPHSPWVASFDHFLGTCRITSSIKR